MNLTSGKEIVIVISGATGGLGTAILENCLHRFEADSAKMICLVRDKEKLSRIFPEGRIHAIRCDFMKPEDSFLALDAELDGVRASRVVFIHAAFDMSPLGHIGSFGADAVAANINANVCGFVKMLNHLVAFAQDRAVKLDVVNIDSGAAYRPIDGWSLYCSGKAYVNMMLRCCAQELDVVRSVTYEPGVMDTSMQAFIRDAAEEQCACVETFISYYNEGILRDCRLIARDIVDRYVENWVAREFEERFFG